MSGIHEVFVAFAQGQEMDGRSFQKCMKATGLQGSGLTTTDIDLIFAKQKAKGAKKIEFQGFLSCLGDVAAKKRLSQDEVIEHVLSASGPSFDSGVTQGGSSTHGPERFFYDKSTFTGTHTKGGPTTSGSGTSTEGYADLSGLIRREHVQDDWVNQRRQSSLSQSPKTPERPERLQQGAFRPTGSPAQRGSRPGSSSGVQQARPGSSSGMQQTWQQPLQRTPSRGSVTIAQSGTTTTVVRPRSRGASKPAARGPERSFYDQSTYTGTHTCGAADDSLDVEVARGTSPAARPRSRGGSKTAVRGPERFFYDQSTYTGSHTRGSASSANHPADTPVLLGTAGPRCKDLSDSRSMQREKGRAQQTESSPAGSKAQAAPRQLRGPERFFYDKSSYTGVHQAGGPSTIDTNSGGGRVGDLSQITRTGLGPKQGR